MTSGEGAGRVGARLHHCHLMASDVDSAIEFWCHCFGAELVADEALAGTRNVLLDVGGGRLNLYAKPPNQRGPVNHLGVQVADLSAAVERLQAAGHRPRPIKSDGPLSYAMVEGPDGVLIEVFHFDDATADHLRPYFDLPPKHPAPSAGDHNGTERADRPEPPADLGAGMLSAEARARLARPRPKSLDPPAADDLAAVSRWRRGIHDLWLAGDSSAQACGHREEYIAGVRCLRSGPDPQVRNGREVVGEGDAPPLIVYFHGGGYVLGSPEVSLPITERLAAHGDVVSVDYRLAPEHPYPAAIQDGLAVCRALASTGWSARRPLVLAGDSAGANLALSVAMAAGSAAGLILLSPHLDHQLDPGHRRLDPLSDVDHRSAAWLSSCYRAGIGPGHPGVSPLLSEPADLVALPPILIQAGTIDDAFDDAVRFARRARAAGVTVTLDIWHGLWHTWHYHRELPEAARALAEAGRFATDAARR